MKITTISYKKIFPGQIAFTNETIGVEIQIDEGDDLDIAFQFAKHTVNLWHREPNPDHSAVVVNGIVYPAPVYPAQPVEINIQDEKKEISIENASTMEELAALKNGLPSSLMPAYMDKLRQLTKNQVSV